MQKSNYRQTNRRTNNVRKVMLKEAMKNVGKFCFIEQNEINSRSFRVGNRQDQISMLGKNCNLSILIKDNVICVFVYYYRKLIIIIVTLLIPCHRQKTFTCVPYLKYRYIKI